MKQLSIIAPCFNEEANVENLLARVEDLFKDRNEEWELVLVDDGSTDDTWQIIERMSKEKDTVVAIKHEKNAGITEAWETGLDASSGKYVITIDADMQYRPEEIVSLYDVIKDSEYDLVQGWRRIYKEASLLRRLLSRGLSVFLNILFLTNIQDIKSGFVVYKREALKDILQDRKKFRLYQHFIILCALAKKYSFFQVPISFDPRTAGESFITNPFQFSTQVLLDLPRAYCMYGPLARIIKNMK